MGYSGARAFGAASRGVYNIGDALMRIGQRQDDDERYAAEQAHVQGRERLADQRYQQERMHDLRTEGYDVQPGQATALGRAIMGANAATGVSGPSYTVGALDVTKSQAFQSAKALRDMENNASLEATEYALRNLHQGPTRQADVALPENVREQSRNEARSTALGILQKLGNTPEAREEINKIPGIYGGYVSSAFHDAVADKALADQTRDNDEPNFQSVTGPDGRAYTFNPRDGSYTPAPNVGPKPQQAPDAAPDLNLDQGKSVAFYQRGRPALDIVQELSADYGGGEEFGAPGWLQRQAGRLPAAGNFFKGTNLRRYDQAADDFGMAVLRKDSGASLTADERQYVRDNYIPQPNDDPQTARQKLQAAEIAIESMRATAGPGQTLMGPRPQGLEQRLNMGDQFRARFEGRR